MNFEFIFVLIFAELWTYYYKFEIYLRDPLNIAERTNPGKPG